MSNIQKTLDALQPYVIGIRYVEGSAVVDTVFKEGWVLPDSEKIKKAKGDNELNYHMIYSDIEGVGLDNLLAYIETTIKLNVDREKKHELLKTKVNELKEVFKKNSLDRLNRLTFSFGEEELSTDINELNVDAIKEKEKLKELVQPKTAQFLDADKRPIPVTEEDIEEADAEARAEAFLRNQRLKRMNGQVKTTTNKTIELPPKKDTIATPSQPTCNCGPEEACSKCMDYKGF